MTKYLKYVWMIIAALYVLGSCGLYRQKKSDKLQSSTKDWQNTVLTQHWYSLQRDSLSRSWYFWTDSSFRFHPDSGFNAFGGLLFVQESKTSNDLKNAASVEVSHRETQTTQKSITEKRKTITAMDLWIIISITIALLLIWKFRKFFKTFLLG